MLKQLFHSIVFRIGSMILLISVVSIVSMLSSVLISELADQDAFVINNAGSLRYESYKILTHLTLLPRTSQPHAAQQAKIHTAIDAFSHKLNFLVKQSNPNLLNTMAKPAIENSLTTALSNWKHNLAPKLLLFTDEPAKLNEDNLFLLDKQIEAFVNHLDQLVGLYQKGAEDRILMIRMILSLSLLITITLAAFILYQLHQKIEKPLSELTQTARKIMSGDYTSRTQIQQNDELGLLSDTMNRMSEALSNSYGELEKRVEEKTSESRQSNDSLALLYQTSQLINQSGTSLNLKPIINQLSNITNKTDIDLCLTTEQSNVPYEHIITQDKPLPITCLAKECDGCLNTSKKPTTNPQVARYAIQKDDINYGVLICHLSKNTALEPWQDQLFSSISTLIANGLHIRQQHEQSRRIALLKERNAIARELHDSLAQALSYLKMQVARLQKLRLRQANNTQIEDVELELKNGLNNAYKQLRELLTTFRLKIDEEGLYQTFIYTVNQLNERAKGQMLFHLDYQIQNLPLTPNEEIHLMQIAREATQNALNHSKAKVVNVRVFSDLKKQIHLCIEDNGIGLPEQTAKLNHYGLAIMQERSQHLKGELNIHNSAQGGARIELIFMPNYVQIPHSDVA